MSAVADLKPVKKTEVANNEVIIYGKVLSIRDERLKDKSRLFFTLIRLPSSGDEFETPGTVEVMSREKFGQPNELVTQRCRLTGYGRSYQKKPDEDGVIQSVRTADVKLRAVE